MEVGGGLASVLGWLVRSVTAVVTLSMIDAAFFRASHGYWWHAAGFEMPFVGGGLMVGLLIDGAGPFSLFAWVEKRRISWFMMGRRAKLISQAYGMGSRPPDGVFAR